MKGGFIVVPRGWMDNPIFGRPAREPLSRHAAWLWMVEKAAFKPMAARVEGRAIELARGELSVSMRDLSKEWGWAVTGVHRFVSELFQHRFIATKKIGRQFVISICNYEQFSFHKEPENSSDETKLERSWNDPFTRAGSYQVSEIKEYSDTSVSGGEPPIAFDPIKNLWDRGLAIFGKDRRSLLGKYRKMYGDPVVLAAIVECEKEMPSDPAAYFVACCERRKVNGSGNGSAASAVEKLRAWAMGEDEQEGFRGHYHTPVRHLRRT